MKKQKWRHSLVAGLCSIGTGFRAAAFNALAGAEWITGHQTWWRADTHERASILRTSFVHASCKDSAC